MEQQPRTTSIEQSKRLLELGLDPQTADMTWSHNPWTPERAYGENEHILYARPGMTTGSDPVGIPAWTAEAMLNVLPETIQQGENIGHLYIYRDFYHHWVILYESKGEGKGYAVNTQPTLLLAAYHMLTWWLTNIKQ